MTDDQRWTILAVLPITLATPKSWEGRLARPGGWMVTVILVAFAAVGLRTAGTDWARVESAAIAGVVVMAAARWVPWAWLPPTMLLFPALGCDVVVASHWTSLARDSDVVGRIGGDEFAVILEQADEGTAREVADRLVRGLPAGRGCSVGVASWDGAEDALALVTRADAGMYQDKRAAKGSALESMA